MVRTIAAIPADVADADLPAMLEYAWCHLLVDRHRFMRAGRQAHLVGRPAGHRPGLRPRVTMLQSIRATVGGRWVDGGMLARQALHRPWAQAGGATRSAGSAGTWWPARWRCPSAGTRRATTSARPSWRSAVDPERRLSFEGTRALGEALAGHPVDALRVAAARPPRRRRHRHDGPAVRARARPRRSPTGRWATRPGAGRAGGPRRHAAGPLLYCQVLAAAELVQAHLDEGDIAAARRGADRGPRPWSRPSRSGPTAAAGWPGPGTLVALAEGA